MQVSNAPTSFPIPFANSAGTGYIRTIPQASQISVQNGAASLTDGFPPLTFLPVAAGGVPPFGQDMNGILYETTLAMQWMQAGYVPPYNSSFSSSIGGYPKGAVITNATYSGAWLSAADNNTTNPDTGGAGWVAAFMSGTVGQVRNLAMSVTTASATATLTADEIVVGSALAGQKYVLGSFSKTINLATTGAGGMDTGSAPASGFVALYAIYNPTTSTAALLATNATSTVAPSVYGGANMPSGYTASALVSVWPTSGSGTLIIGKQQDRRIMIAQQTGLTTTTQQASLTTLSLATIIPPNAKTFGGYQQIGSSASSSAGATLYPTTPGVGNETVAYSLAAGSAISVGFDRVMVSAQQQTGYTFTSTAGTSTYVLFVNRYEF